MNKKRAVDNTVTRKIIVKKVAQITGRFESDVRETMEVFFNVLTEEIAKGNRIELRNVGVFETPMQAAKVGRNPYSGERVEIPAKRRIRFKPGLKLKRAVPSVGDK